MRKRRRRNNTPYLRWIKTLLLSAAVIFVFVSLFTPENLLYTGLANAGILKPADTISYDKQELWNMYQKRDSTVKALRDTVDYLLGKRHFQTAKVNAEHEVLNMRTGPSLQDSIILQIPGGSKVDVLYYDTEQYILGGEFGKWCKVRYAGQQGWVWGNYLDIL